MSSLVKLSVLAAGSLLFCACNVSMDPEALRPALTQAAADPVVIAELCRTAAEAVGPVSASRLTLSSIAAERPLVGSDGTGTADVEYLPIAASGSGTACRGRLVFEFSDDASATHFTFRNLRVEPR
jgi:hypothetical protein